MVRHGNNDIIIHAHAGTMVIRPYGYSIWESIQSYLDARSGASSAFSHTIHITHCNACMPMPIRSSSCRRFIKGCCTWSAAAPCTSRIKPLSATPAPNPPEPAAHQRVPGVTQKISVFYLAVMARGQLVLIIQRNAVLCYAVPCCLCCLCCACCVCIHPYQVQGGGR